MTVHEENGHASYRHEIHDALPAFDAAEEVYTTSVITNVPDVIDVQHVIDVPNEDVLDEAASEAMLGNVNGVTHTTGE
jgi:hypothetical protein